MVLGLCFQFLFEIYASIHVCICKHINVIHVFPSDSKVVKYTVNNDLHALCFSTRYGLGLVHRIIYWRLSISCLDVPKYVCWASSLCPMNSCLGISDLLQVSLHISASIIFGKKPRSRIVSQRINAYIILVDIPTILHKF